MADRSGVGRGEVCFGLGRGDWLPGWVEGVGVWRGACNRWVVWALGLGRVGLWDGMGSIRYAFVTPCWCFVTGECSWLRL
jgi:hypothetical protein